MSLIKAFGKSIKKSFGHLLPSSEFWRHNRIPNDDSSHTEKKKHDKHQPKHSHRWPPFKLWTASSTRDIESSLAFMDGLFLKNQTGKKGEGDGVHLQLVKVPNKQGKGWEQSLTPHKACSAFEKESSLEPAAKWLHVFAPRIRDRLNGVVPRIASRLEDEDVLGMFMLCAYESINQGYSGFCGLFTEEEFKDAEYYFDIKYHYMMGYGNKLSPTLGRPWVKSARHLLAGEVEDDRDGDGRSDDPDHPGRPGDDADDDITSDWDVAGDWFTTQKSKKGKKPGAGLPQPRFPPNGTHTQLLHLFFTHRESPAFVSTVLNLFNSTDPELGPAAGADPDLTRRPEPRQWKTSNMVAFLGHVAIEKFECDKDSLEDHYVVNGNKHEQRPSFVRVMVNGQQAMMHGCDSGPGQSCAWEEWKEWIDGRLEHWNNWNEMCEDEEDYGAWF